MIWTLFLNVNNKMVIYMQSEPHQNKIFDVNNKPKGLRRLYLASKNSVRAISWLFTNESAFRQECVALFIAILLSFFLDISFTEKLLLISSVLFVILCEIINTAIEVIVDRIGLEINPQSGLAKDLGSAAVSISIFLAIIAWLGVLIN